MQEKEIQVFIDGTKKFFKTLTQRDVIIGTPYLVTHDELPCFDYTGIIGISGDRKGAVYFTAPRILLRHLLLSLGEKADDNVMMRDVVGEVANTISGNARSAFGSGFMISVPLVVQGLPEKLYLPSKMHAYVIPIQWNSYTSSLLVGLE